MAKRGSAYSLQRFRTWKAMKRAVFNLVAVDSLVRLYPYGCCTTSIYNCRHVSAFPAIEPILNIKAPPLPTCTSTIHTPLTLTATKACISTTRKSGIPRVSFPNHQPNNLRHLHNLHRYLPRHSSSLALRPRPRRQTRIRRSPLTLFQRFGTYHCC